MEGNNMNPLDSLKETTSKAASPGFDTATNAVSNLSGNIRDLTGDLKDFAGGLNLPDISSLLPEFATPFEQNRRLITLELGAGEIAGEQLLPQTVRGTEALGQPYRFEIDCLSPSADIELKTLLGQPAKLGILTSADQKTIRCGLITRTEALPSDGGFARYRLVFEPPLALLKHRRTSRVFQDKTVPDIVKTLLDEHIATNPAFGAGFALRFDLTQTYPPRSYCLQYRESDLEFIDRLLREEGINTRFEHVPADEQTEDDEDTAAGEDGEPAGGHAWESSETEDTHPLVTLVAFDDPYSPPRASQHQIRFHRADATEADDTLTDWTSARELGAGRVSLSSFEYKGVITHTGIASTDTTQGESGQNAQSSLEDFDAQTLYYGDPDAMDRYARLRQEATDRHKKTFHGQGNVRQLRAGEWFELTGHPQLSGYEQGPEQREFVVEKLTLVAHNNLPDGLRTEPDKAPPEKAPPFHIQIEAQRRGIPLTPDFAHQRHAKPRSNGLQTATVVGPLTDTDPDDAPAPCPTRFIQTNWAASKSSFIGNAPKNTPNTARASTNAPPAGSGSPTRARARDGATSSSRESDRKCSSTSLKATSTGPSSPASSTTAGSRRRTSPAKETCPPTGPCPASRPRSTRATSTTNCSSMTPPAKSAQS
jgi:uncharacterized protein involved in type VI secretion and phage assembly